ITWGHAWQWGYYKHPPFSSWVLYGFYAVLGNYGPFVLSQLCVLATLYFVWRLGRAMGSVQQAWLGALLTLGVAYYTRPALEFNHNIAQ
ncbi:glycosyltransferase family 39 protein, partial [Klebsiella pneumoniae]|uniref:glycosyltransferase family 39 protein n=1 Tax=Klebsiella pneumoniae TaxID=573 RepID=UPI0027307C14